MIKKITFVCLAFTSLFANAQCDSVQISGDLIVSSDVLMSGTYVVSGNFNLQSGVTIYVTPYSNNGCGELKIYAQNITIAGTINGDYAGYNGGLGGSKGLIVASSTGSSASLTSCNDEGSQGHISVEGGKAGLNGQGPGFGSAGQNGGNGAGSKQYCGNFGDDAGLVAGSGGAGGGAGGSYGGLGTNAGNGGNGSNTSTNTDLTIESSYAATFGAGGLGGVQGVIYGTSSSFDISMGSGGAGAGGGGRSYYLGGDGIRGGNGGGLVFLKSIQNITISGTISVNGEAGSYGGNGGSGDATADCCSDGCNGCDERTISAGSGAGAGSGGGSGGGIYIETQGSASISGSLNASGGIGGNSGQKGTGANCNYSGGGFCSSNSITTGDGNMGNDGGSGGGGRIKVFVPECAQAILNPTVNVTGGAGFFLASDGTYEPICGYASLNEQLSELNWNLYPNPVSDQFTINLENLDFTGQSSVEIINTMGQVIQTVELTGTTSLVPCQEIESGIYLVRLTHNNATSIKKIIKK
jgi:hypothetical protein